MHSYALSSNRFNFFVVRLLSVAAFVPCTRRTESFSVAVVSLCVLLLFLLFVWSTKLWVLQTFQKYILFFARSAEKILNACMQFARNAEKKLLLLLLLLFLCTKLWLLQFFVIVNDAPRLISF